MRHESQAIVIEKLRKLIETIEGLPATAVVNCFGGTRHDSEFSIQLSNETFSEMFAGETVELWQGSHASIHVGDAKYYAGILTTRADGPYVMPALETAKGGA